MKTPRDKYLNDPQFRSLVDMMESYINNVHFTPSEMLEAAVMASINYEMRHIRNMTINAKVEESLRIINDFTSNKEK